MDIEPEPWTTLRLGSYGQIFKDLSHNEIGNNQVKVNKKILTSNVSFWKNMIIEGLVSFV